MGSIVSYAAYDCRTDELSGTVHVKQSDSNRPATSVVAGACISHTDDCLYVQLHSLDIFWDKIV